MRLVKNASFLATSSILERIIHQAELAEHRIHSVLREILTGIDRAIALDYTLLGEFFKVSSVFYYVMICIVTFLLTGTARTADARLPLIRLNWD